MYDDQYDYQDEENPEEIAGTSKLDDRQDFPDALFGSLRSSGMSHIKFTTLPRGLPPWKNRDMRWRLLLDGLLPGAAPIAIEVASDVTLGRSKPGSPPDTMPDLNLENYKAADKGVSRKHAMLRPTRNHLFLMDLGSTNGTMHNAIPLGPGIARSVSNNDVISLGNLNITIKIVRRPKAASEPRDGDRWK